MKHLNSKSSYLGRYDFWRLFIIGILVYTIIQIVYFSAWQTWFANNIVHCYFYNYQYFIFCIRLYNWLKTFS